MGNSIFAAPDGVADIFGLAMISFQGKTENLHRHGRYRFFLGG